MDVHDRTQNIQTLNIADRIGGGNGVNEVNDGVPGESDIEAKTEVVGKRVRRATNRPSSVQNKTVSNPTDRSGDKIEPNWISPLPIR